ncbi:MAG: sigma-70 family RNA polymerase sigma factor [bacterium]
MSEDLEWVRRSQDGDQEAFSELVRKYQKRVYYLAYGMTGNREDALDIAQEAFLKAFRSMKGFQGGGGFYTWIYRITYNQTIDFMRKEWRKKKLEYQDNQDLTEKESPIMAVPSASNPGQDMAQKELNRVIMDAVQSLPEQHRSVILLREIEGLSYDEIAEMLRIRKGTVMSRLHYARQELQKVLMPYIKEGEIREKK